MYCKKCGNQVDEGSAFCKKCGAPMGEDSYKADTGAGGSVMPVNVKPIRIGIIAASLLMAIATLLPWIALDTELAFHAGVKSISLLNPGEEMGDGIGFIILAVIMIVFLCLKKNIPVLVCGILSFLLYCYDLSQTKAIYREMQGYTSHLSKGSGFYLLTLSVIALLVLSIIYFTKNRKARKRNG